MIWCPKVTRTPHWRGSVEAVIVESTRFGPLEVSDDEVIDFGPGLLGFSEASTYLVVEIPDQAHYCWLQSCEMPELAFLVTRPWEFFPDYEIDVPDEIQEQIALSDPSDSDIFLLLTVHRDGEEPLAFTANLLGPIVINTQSRQARQLVLDSKRYGTREPLVAS